MMSLVLAALASAAVHPTVEGCAVAVRAQSRDALTLCVEPPVDLMKADDLSSECRAVLQIGKSTQMVPANRRAALLEQFEKAYISCLTPKPDEKVRQREVKNLWD